MKILMSTLHVNSNSNSNDNKATNPNPDPNPSSAAGCAGIVGVLSDIVWTDTELCSYILSKKRSMAMSTIIVTEDTYIRDFRKVTQAEFPQYAAYMSISIVEQSIGGIPSLLDEDTIFNQSQCQSQSQSQCNCNCLIDTNAKYYSVFYPHGHQTNASSGSSGSPSGSNNPISEHFPTISTHKSHEPPPIPGFLGYAINLLRLRPEHEYLRRNVLWIIFRDLMVFDTLESQIQYTECLHRLTMKINFYRDRLMGMGGGDVFGGGMNVMAGVGVGLEHGLETEVSRIHAPFHPLFHSCSTQSKPKPNATATSTETTETTEAVNEVVTLEDLRYHVFTKPYCVSCETYDPSSEVPDPQWYQLLQHPSNASNTNTNSNTNSNGNGNMEIHISYSITNDLSTNHIYNNLPTISSTSGNNSISNRIYSHRTHTHTTNNTTTTDNMNPTITPITPITAPIIALHPFMCYGSPRNMVHTLHMHSIESYLQRHQQYIVNCQKSINKLLLR